MPSGAGIREKARKANPERQELEDEVVTMYFQRMPMSQIARALNAKGRQVSVGVIQGICKRCTN